MPKRLAVVLRGPMGVGKSTVADELCRLLSTVPKIVLDDHFQIRGLARDAIFSPRSENALVIELGCGEPTDLSFDGFTRGAQAWYDALLRDGREVHFFKLWAGWPTIQKNMSSRRSDHLLWASLWHRAYSTELDVVSLPPSLAGLEVTIDVTGKPPTQVANEVFAAVR